MSARAANLQHFLKGCFTFLCLLCIEWTLESESPCTQVFKLMHQLSILSSANLEPLKHRSHRGSRNTAMACSLTPLFHRSPSSYECQLGPCVPSHNSCFTFYALQNKSSCTHLGWLLENRAKST